MNKLYLSGTIDRLEGAHAVIKIDNGQKIDWPIENMPEGLGEGSAVKISINDEKSEKTNQEQIAKQMLNEILKTNDGNATQQLDQERF
ncbi:MAG TPA: DUF3006 domain-containing protein [Patescibacteria group bacterium]|nr:DUF3006 domain-containing protein [Patescibacteria group bacterium]